MHAKNVLILINDNHGHFVFDNQEVFLKYLGPGGYFTQAELGNFAWRKLNYEKRNYTNTFTD